MIDRRGDGKGKYHIFNIPKNPPNAEGGAQRLYVIKRRGFLVSEGLNALTISCLETFVNKKEPLLHRNRSRREGDGLDKPKPDSAALGCGAIEVSHALDYVPQRGVSLAGKTKLLDHTRTDVRQGVVISA